MYRPGWGEWLVDKAGNATISVLDEMKFWGEVFIEYMEWDQSSSDRMVEEFRKEAREQMEENKDLVKEVHKMRVERGLSDDEGEKAEMEEEEERDEETTKRSILKHVKNDSKE